MNPFQVYRHMLVILFTCTLFVIPGWYLPFAVNDWFEYNSAADSVCTQLSDGKTESTVIFDTGGGTDSTLKFSLPKQSEIISAKFKVSGESNLQYDYPTNVKIDVGDDGDLEWEYNLSGAGSLGKQTVFVGGINNKLYRLNTGDFDNGLILRLPRSANVIAANLDVTGYSHGVPNGNFSTGTLSGWNVITNQYSDTVAVQNTRGGNDPGAGWGATGNYLMLRSIPFGSHDGSCNIIVESDRFPRFNNDYITMDWDLVENDHFNAYIRIEDDNNNFVTAKSEGGDNNVDHTDTQVAQTIDIQSLNGQNLNLRLRLWGTNVLDWPWAYNNWGRLAVDGIYLSDVSGNPDPIYPKDVKVDFGSDGVYEFNEAELKSTKPVLGLMESLNSLLANPSPSCQITSDKYGNEYLDIPINLTVISSPGLINLTNLEILYEYEAKVETSPGGDLSEELNSLIPESGTGNVQIPILISSTTGGKIKISGIDIKYNAVITVGTIPDLEILEDSLNPKIIDLDDYFTDDSTEPIKYDIAQNSVSEKLEAYIESGHYLTLNSNLEQDWYGQATIIIRATDEHGLSTDSRPITVEVLPVNDEPRPNLPLTKFTLFEDSSGLRISLNDIPYFTDAENDPLFYFADVDPEGKVPDSAVNLKVVISADNELTIQPLNNLNGYGVPVVLYCDDDNDPIDILPTSPHQTFSIDIIPVNDPPKIELEDSLYIDEDNDLNDWVNLLEVASDPETPDDKLIFSIANDNEGNILVTIDENKNIDIEVQKPDYVGTAKVKITVTDEQGETAEDTVRIYINSINDGPRLIKSPGKITMYEDNIDKSSLNIYDIFFDPDSPNTYSIAGNKHISISISQENGTVILKPEKNWNGNEMLIFTARDTFAESGSVQKLVQVAVNVTVLPVNDPPETPEIKSPQVPRSNLAEHEITFISGEAIDVDGDRVSYYWDFDNRIDSDGDGDTTNDRDAEGKEVVYKYSHSGHYFVTLIATDGELNSTPPAGVYVKVTTNYDSISKKLSDEPGVTAADVALSIIFIIIILILIVLIFNLLRKQKRESMGEKDGTGKKGTITPEVLDGELIAEPGGPASTSAQPSLPAQPSPQPQLSGYARPAGQVAPAVSPASGDQVFSTGDSEKTIDTVATPVPPDRSTAPQPVSKPVARFEEKQ